MLNSDSFARLLQILSGKYDRIIIDSPPVTPVTDAQIIANICDLTLLVLRAEKSTRNISRRALDGLLSVGGRVLGVVVNDVKKRSKYGNYSGYGYHHGYYGYGNNEERSVQGSGPIVNIRELNSHSRMKVLPERRCTSVNQQSRQLLDVVQAYTQPQFGDENGGYSQFTLRNCEEWTGLSYPAIRRRLAHLVGVGIVEVDESSRPYKYRVAHHELAETADLYLPPPQDGLEHINSITY